MAFIITTTGLQDPVILNDLAGVSYPHPTTSYDLTEEFSIDEIRESGDTQIAIDNNWITVVDENGTPINNVGDTAGTPFVTQIEAEQGTETEARMWSPERVGQGVAANETFYSVEWPYAWNSASPLDSSAVIPAGDEIVKSVIDVDVAFDDPLATLRLVVAGGPVILEVTENDPAESSAYEQPESVPITAPAAGRLVISPGISTQGSGKVILTVKRS